MKLTYETCHSSLRATAVIALNQRVNNSTLAEVCKEYFSNDVMLMRDTLGVTITPVGLVGRLDGLNIEYRDSIMIEVDYIGGKDIKEWKHSFALIFKSMMQELATESGTVRFSDGEILKFYCPFAMNIQH